MKRYLHPIYAMSTINPKMQKGWAIEVVIYDNNEGSVPHVHVYHDATRDKCAYIRLDKAEYSLHDDQNSPNSKNYPLSKKQLAQFIQVMSSPWPKHFIELNDGTIRVATGYEYAVMTWIDAYGDKEADKFTWNEDGSPRMPDYLLLR